MGRAAKFDRGEVLDWAMNEVWSKGFSSLSVKAISETMGMTRSSFYHSFESLDALFLEVMARYFQLSPYIKLQGVTSSRSPLELLTQVFKETCQARSDDDRHRGCMMVNSVAELASSHDHLGPILKDMVHESISGFERLLEQSVEKGELANDTDIQQLALAVQNTLIGLNTLSKVITDEQQLWDAVKSILISLKVYRAEAH